MKKYSTGVGVLVIAAILLFGAGLFLIGNQHKAFRHHTDFYTEFANIGGVAKGTKVNVNGMDAGQVDDIQIPSSPAKRFRLKMTVDNRLHGLIRSDSVVSIESAGIVGDKFLLIHAGSDHAPEAASDSTLPSKEPFDFGKMLEQANGLMKQANGTIAQVNGAITDVQGKLDGTLDAVTKTVNNTNGIVTDIRAGKGTAGVLLEDPKTAASVKQIVANAQQTTANLNTASTQVNSVLNEVQSRHLVAKMDNTLQNADGAAKQLNQASQQVNTTLKTAFGEDQYGETAGSNLQQSLANVNQATGNLADDTEALKHEFFFSGFFKKRGYDSLDDLPVSPYRDGKLFKKLPETRQWLAADSLFDRASDGTETLSATGREQLDNAVSQIPDLYSSPLIVEGYDDSGTTAHQLLQSRQRATIVRAYLQIHFHLMPKNVGVIALSATPPTSAGKSTWSGVCLVHLPAAKP